MPRGVAEGINPPPPREVPEARHRIRMTEIRELIRYRNNRRDTRITIWTDGKMNSISDGTSFPTLACHGSPERIGFEKTCLQMNY